MFFLIVKSHMLDKAMQSFWGNTINKHDINVHVYYLKYQQKHQPLILRHSLELLVWINVKTLFRDSWQFLCGNPMQEAAVSEKLHKKHNMPLEISQLDKNFF